MPKENVNYNIKKGVSSAEIEKVLEGIKTADQYTFYYAKDGKWYAGHKVAGMSWQMAVALLRMMVHDIARFHDIIDEIFRDADETARKKMVG